MAQSPKPRYSTGQRVSVRVTDFDTPGFPDAWMAGTITEVTSTETGLWDVLVTRDHATAGNRLTRILVGRRGGGRNIRESPDQAGMI
jgi:hypothetical protein